MINPHHVHYSRRLAPEMVQSDNVREALFTLDEQNMAMPLYKIAFILSGLLLVPLAFIQVMMRRQVHNANYGIGSSDISSWDVRFVNAMFGRHGIWNLHKKAYERSALRSSFTVIAIAWLAVVLFAALDFVMAHR